MEIQKKLEAGANAATIVLAVLFGWAVLHGSFTQPKSQNAARQTPTPQLGSDLKKGPLKDVNWAANGRTLILGLQTTCHFCTESGPFLRKLPEVASGRTKIVAVLPQSIQESKQYLDRLGVRVDEIRSEPLSSVGVSGTPTILLADNNGVVRKVWVGKLPDDRQADVFSAIRP